LSGLLDFSPPLKNPWDPEELLLENISTAAIQNNRERRPEPEYSVVFAAEPTLEQSNESKVKNINSLIF
jgi:hypothetical protein